GVEEALATQSLGGNGALPEGYLQFAKKVAAQIIYGVAACHANDIAHRDLKPQNILYSGTVESPRICIADFGLARFMREETGY
ncbi:MAG: hypothetical protein KVP17_000303, partial [Porospora cf. gigantea B]|uniref:uncharacterized protein n=1 Tax=Porospora cf. gigantea B TaxID=2853592 RepID=UPI0035719ABE